MKFAKFSRCIFLYVLACFGSALAGDKLYAPIPYGLGTQAPPAFDIQEYQRMLDQATQGVMNRMPQLVAPPVLIQGPSIGYFGNGQVEWLWINGNRFDMNFCEDRIKLKKFVTEGRHNYASQVQMPSGYTSITQAGFEAYALNLDCTMTQKAKKWLGK
jgi:hypothetical protein